MEQKKTCTKCKQSKNLSEFYLRNGKPRSTCMTCCKIETSKNSKKRKKKIKEGDPVYFEQGKIWKTPQVEIKSRKEEIMEKIGNGIIYVIYLLLLAHIGIGISNIFYFFKIY